MVRSSGLVPLSFQRIDLRIIIFRVKYFVQVEILFIICILGYQFDWYLMIPSKNILIGFLYVEHTIVDFFHRLVFNLAKWSRNTLIITFDCITLKESQTQFYSGTMAIPPIMDKTDSRTINSIVILFMDESESSTF